MKIETELVGKFKYAFVFPFSYDILEFCRYLRTRYGAVNFNFIQGKWRFTGAEAIDMLVHRFGKITMDDACAWDLYHYVLDREEKIQAEGDILLLKKKKKSSLTIKGIKGKLYDYQKIGIEFFDLAGGRAILGDEMGAGKSAQALGFIVLKNIKKTLVICPASVRYVWEKEIKKWTKLKSFTFNGETDRLSVPEMMKEVVDHDVFIINYDLLAKYYYLLKSINFDCLVGDECHYIKNSQAKRTKLAKDLAKGIKYILLLSGTPLLSRPIELFNSLNLIDPKSWHNWRKFTIDFCAGHQGYFGWDCSGASNIPELKSKIEKYFLRREKSEILPELPPKTLINLPVPMNAINISEYAFAINNFKEYLRSKKGSSDKERSTQAEKLVQLNYLRQITSSGKLPAAEELIENIVNGGEKLIVFSCYNEPLEKLHEKFKNSSVLLIGKTKEQDRRNIIDKFQTDPKIRIFLGGIKSAGVGITLTAASSVLFLDYSWVPADHAQAQDRLHRPGQTAEKIRIYQLYAKNTIDEYMQEILENKQALFDELMGVGTGTSGISLIDELLKKIKENSKDT